MSAILSYLHKPDIVVATIVAILIGSFSFAKEASNKPAPEADSYFHPSLNSTVEATEWDKGD